MYGHAGIVESYDPKTGQVTMISGNTADAVGRGSYSVEEALGFRRPGAAQSATGPASPTATYDYLPEQRRNAIASIESQGSGDYKAIGPITNRQGNRAYGRYQVMASNIPAWTKQALGQEMTPDQFLASPEAQTRFSTPSSATTSRNTVSRAPPRCGLPDVPRPPTSRTCLAPPGMAISTNTWRHLASRGQKLRPARAALAGPPTTQTLISMC